MDPSPRVPQSTGVSGGVPGATKTTSRGGPKRKLPLTLSPAPQKDEYKPGPKFWLVRGKVVVGYVQRSLSGAWVGYKSRNPNQLARAGSKKAIVKKMEPLV